MNQLQGNVFEARIGEAETLKVMPIFDLHFDNAKCNLDWFKRDLDYAKSIGARIWFGGDTFCAMNGRYDKRKSDSHFRKEWRMDDDFNPDVPWGYYTKKFCEFVEPYADLIDLMTYGNHETSVMKNSGYDLIQGVTDRLSLMGHNVHRGRYSTWVRIKFERAGGRSRYTQDWHIFHGHGGGPVTGGAIGTQRRHGYIDADLIMSGHIHDSLTQPRARAFLNSAGRVDSRTQRHIVCPSYKDEFSGGDGWAVEKGSGPRVHGTKVIEVSISVLRDPRCKYKIYDLEH